MRIIRNVLIIIILILLTGNSRQKLFAHDNSNNIPSSEKMILSSSIDVSVQEPFSDVEITQSYSYSVWSFTSLRLQRKISYVNASSSFFIKTLLACYSIHKKSLSTILLKRLAFKTYPFCSYSVQHYVFNLRKIIV